MSRGEEVEDAVGLEEVVAVEVEGWDAESFGSFGDIGVAAVVDDAVDKDAVVVSEVFGDLLCVGAVAGGEDGNANGLVGHG